MSIPPMFLRLPSFPKLAILLLTFSCSFECAKLAKKAVPKPAVDAKPNFADLDLEKRPLNFYIIANGKHASVLNKTLPTSSNSSNVDYRIARPPFLIKQRGSVLLLNGGNSLDWHFGYPFLLQMLAASGHATVAMEGRQLAKAMEVVGWEELHGLVLIGAGEEGVELAMEAVEKESRVRDQLDAILLANAPEGILGRIEAQLKKGIGRRKPFWVLLNRGRALASDFLNGEAGFVKALAEEWDPAEPGNAQKLAQIAVNLLDFVHQR